MLTTAEVCTRLGTDRKTVRRLVDRGSLTPAFKLPGVTGAYLFDRAEVEALAAERTR
ncbi:helix-turn-helix domain-containing protein [Cellulomonas sp. NPDC089187]|uniref:helix-turn-helix domain-containing protein n=1 Tax=Cellulomonas sp. NPDC089187 TaxID=3154970 RepID=UPI003449818E